MCDLDLVTGYLPNCRIHKYTCRPMLLGKSISTIHYLCYAFSLIFLTKGIIDI